MAQDSKNLPFWEMAKARTKKHSLRQAISMARSNKDFKNKYPDETRDLVKEPPNKVRTAERINKKIDKAFEEEKQMRKQHGKRR